VRDRVLQDRSSILVREAQLDDEFKGRMRIVEQEVHTMMAVPLQTQERITGPIYVDSPLVLREFTRDDLGPLTVMANVAAAPSGWPWETYRAKACRRRRWCSG